MQLHTLQPKTKARGAKRVGRGAKRGKTSGRGTKGQNARSGNKRRPEYRDIIKKIPKARGYRFQSFQERASAVNLRDLEATFTAGDSVTLVTLLEKGLIEKHGGKMPVVKILGSGTITKKLSVSGIPVSANAKKAIEAAGGSVNEKQNAENTKPKQNKEEKN